MEYLSTPEENFECLPDYAFKPNYIKVDNSGLRMHYLDEGPPDGEVVLLLHGEPSWSFLYRKMIPILTEAGLRVIAPDLVGFGKSDKPVNVSDYTYEKHLNWLQCLVTSLDLQHINMFLQDWGGLLGLRMLPLNNNRINRLILANTILPTGQIPANEAFLKWRDFSQKIPVFDAGGILNMGTVNPLSEDIVKAYNAPFPSEEYKAGARAFPVLVPVDFEDVEAAKNRKISTFLSQFEKPCLTLFSDSDPIMMGGEKYFKKLIPGTKAMPHEIINTAGHFLQEDKGKEIAHKLVQFIREY